MTKILIGVLSGIFIGAIIYELISCAKPEWCECNTNNKEKE